MALPDDLIADLGSNAQIAAGSAAVLAASMQLLNTSVQIASVHLTQVLPAALESVAAAAQSAVAAVSGRTAATAPPAHPGQQGTYGVLPSGAAGPTDPDQHYRLLPPDPAAPTAPASRPGADSLIVQALAPIGRDVRLIAQAFATNRPGQPSPVASTATAGTAAGAGGADLSVLEATADAILGEAQIANDHLAGLGGLIESQGGTGRSGASGGTAGTAPPWLSFTDGLRQALGGIMNLGNGLGRVTAALLPLQQVGDLASRGVKAAVDALTPFAKKIGEDFARASQQALQALAPLGPAVSAIASRAGAALGGMGQAGMGAVGAVVGTGRAAAGGALAVAGGALAGVDAVIGTFSRITSQAANFVESLNPASMLVFQQALRDLSATIGVALQPVIGVATQVLRDFAATLRPVMERLRPVIQQLSEAFGKVAGTVINAFGGVMQALAPVIKIVADTISAMAPVIQAMAAIFSGLVEVIASAVRGLLASLGVDVRDVTSGLRSAFEKLAQGAILATGALVKLVGGGGALDNYIRGVRSALFGDGVEKKDTTGLAAPTSASVSDLTSFGRTVTQAALLAGPDSSQPAKTSEQWLEKMSDQLDKLQIDPDKFIKDFVDALVEALSQMAHQTAAPVWEGAKAGFAAGGGNTVLNILTGSVPLGR